jgi:NhaP-type Na+/H+ or K+/H+ antiporter
VRRIAQLLVFVLLGLGLAWVLRVDPAALPHSIVYHIAAYTLLAVGLYGATFGIDLQEARQDKRIILTAVTVGVVLKAILIGGIVSLAFRDPVFIVLGVAVAQIDPLSVAALMNDERMSLRARNILAAWSSFDDPVTVILAIYAAAVAANTFGIGTGVHPSAAAAGLNYAIDLGGNALLAAAAWLLWRVVRQHSWWPYVLLAVCVVIAVATGWMLAIAIIGLFARPRWLAPAIPRITAVALYAAAGALGILLIGGIDLAAGVALGTVAFGAQAVVAWLLTPGMPRNDRWHLAAAQQHGITAIVLALTLEIQFSGAVAVIAPTIVTANVLHWGVNHLLDRRLGRPAGGIAAGSQQVAPVDRSSTG